LFPLLACVCLRGTARKLGLNRLTINRWIADGQADRELDTVQVPPPGHGPALALYVDCLEQAHGQRPESLLASTNGLPDEAVRSIAGRVIGEQAGYVGRMRRML